MFCNYFMLLLQAPTCPQYCAVFRNAMGRCLSYKYKIRQPLYYGSYEQQGFFSLSKPNSLFWVSDLNLVFRIHVSAYFVYQLKLLLRCLLSLEIARPSLNSLWYACHGIHRQMLLEKKSLREFIKVYENV